ncbi:MAG: cytochrome c [Lentimicrobium sp.]|nr:cytochrome c [Lentimicrobium sp.]
MATLATRNSASLLTRIAGFVFITLMVTSCYYDNEEYLYPELPGGECDTTGVTYSGVVSPLMASNCNGCHSPAAPSGGVVTSTYEGLKTAVNNGSFRKAINHETGASPMPKNGNKLPDCDLKKIDAWINQGAPQN